MIKVIQILVVLITLTVSICIARAAWYTPNDETDYYSIEIGTSVSTLTFVEDAGGTPTYHEFYISDHMIQYVLDLMGQNQMLNYLIYDDSTYEITQIQVNPESSFEYLILPALLGLAGIICGSIFIRAITPR